MVADAGGTAKDAAFAAPLEAVGADVLAGFVGELVPDRDAAGAAQALTASSTATGRMLLLTRSNSTPQRVATRDYGTSTARKRTLFSMTFA